MLVKRLLPMAAVLLAGCASTAKDPEAEFFSKITSDGDVRLTAWVSAKGGEAMLFPDRQSIRDIHANPPSLRAEEGWPQSTRCVTAFLRDRGNMRAYNGKRVVVTGQIVDYDSFPRRGGDIFPDARVWGDYGIQNWCFSRKILLIRSLKLAG